MKLNLVTPPTEKELVEALSGKMIEKKVAKITVIRNRQHTTSLDTPKTDNPDIRPLIQYTPNTKALPADDLLIAEQRNDLVQKAIARLPEREAKVIRGRFVDGLTLEEVGAKVGLSRERVRQIEGKALEQLTKPHYGLSNL